MAQVSRTTAKGYFNTGDTPTEAQYHDFIDSAKWYDEGEGQASSEAFIFTPSGPFGTEPQGQVGHFGPAPSVTWAAGLLTVTFPAGSTPAYFYMKGDVSAMNNGDLTIRINTDDNKEVKATGLVVKRADGTNQVIFDASSFISVAENVTAGQTNTVFTNLNNINNFDIAIQLAAW